MKFLYSVFLALSFVLSTSGCAPMHFVNGPMIGDTVKREHWHHVMALGLIEVSEPFNLSYYCDNKEWEKVTVLIKAPNLLANVAAVYNPWSIDYECRTPID
jgi:hypothetical protein